MVSRKFFCISGVALWGVLLLVSMFHEAGAQTMGSTNYRIQSDSINFGGGYATSSSYALESTMGEVGTGDSNSSNYILRAGYQQMHTSFLSLSTPDAVFLSPSIPGVTGGTSNGSTTVTVITDNAAGYSLSIVASQNPAMQYGSDVIADYAPGAVPTFNFITNTGDAHLGYSPSGVDVTQRFLDDGASCNVGALDTPLACWDGLSVTPLTIAQGASSNNPDGATTTINFRVGVGASAMQPPGDYTATTTLTALPL